MAKRFPAMDPELKAHQEWLGYLQPVGLVVAPAAMQDAGWVVTRSGSELIDRQARYRAALEPLDDTAELDDSYTEQGFRSLLDLLTEHLGWDDDQLDRSPEAIQAHSKELPELGDTLTPTAVVPAANGEGAQLLVVELPLAAPFDQKSSDADHLWRASAQERLERLLRETGVEAGLLFNGTQLRLVVAPKGESSGHLTFRLSELAEVSGRLMLSGLDLLLGQSHVFLDPDGYRLSDVLKKSRSFQAVVSNALADQVLAALWDLLRGFRQADELSQQQDNPLLGDLPERDAQQLYGGLITMLMRLVFLLYAEDEALMPSDAVYEQNYKLSAIFEQLQQDESEYPDTMEQRFGAWAGLMSLCRLVFDGGGPTVDYLPARHGQLFDPDVYPWLESPWISDGVVLAVLRNLLIVQGERISYRALDVEQIGSVYEGIMGYAVQRIPGRCIGLKSKPQGAKKQITTAVDLDALLEMPGAKRTKWLEDEAGTSLPTKAANALKVADSEDALVEALAPRINRDLFDGPHAAGSLVFQPTEERRRSGSHYTPRSLTRPIVEEALRPWMERCEYRPKASQILDLKICDPAMGSGAFLVESCRYLAELLEQAWTREGLPDALKPGGHALGEESLIYARRLIAQTCLYGVDKNHFAVNLARLSLWLVTLSKGVPFTFLDHCLKEGDSLVHLEEEDLVNFLEANSYIQSTIFSAFENAIGISLRSRVSDFLGDSRTDSDYMDKLAAFAKEDELQASRRLLERIVFADFLSSAASSEALDAEQSLNTKVSESLSLPDSSKALSGILEELQFNSVSKPFSWEAEFPEVFRKDKKGFDAFLGNPPFLGTRLISLLVGTPKYQEWLKEKIFSAKGHLDLCLFFLKECPRLLSEYGTVSFVASSNICRGENRSVGIVSLLDDGFEIYSAESDRSWPGDASVNISTLHVCRSGALPDGFGKKLNSDSVDCINSFLQEGYEPSPPVRLVENIGFAYEGSHYGKGGKGFILKGDEAETLFLEDPDGKVIKYFVGGDDIGEGQGEPLRREKVIFFGGMGLPEAGRFPACLEIARSRVKPEREKAADNGPGNHGKKYWWQFTLRSDPLYEAISPLSRCIVRTKVSTQHAFCFSKTDSVFKNKVIVFPFESDSALGILQSNIHKEWISLFCPKMGKSPTYSLKLGLETFPFPGGWEDSQRLDMVTKKYLHERDSCMRRIGVGLSKFYALVGNKDCSVADAVSFRESVKALDEVVLDLYGISCAELEYGFSEDDDSDLESVPGVSIGYGFTRDFSDRVMSKILRLNNVRASSQVVEGSSFKGKKKASTKPSSGQLDLL